MTQDKNYCNYYEKVEEVYIKTIKISSTNYDLNNPKDLFDRLIKTYDEGTRRESEEAEKEISFLCWLIYNAFMEVRLFTGLKFIPEGYTITSGTGASKLSSTIGKKIIWKYYRKYPDYFETDIEIELPWILDFHKELHAYFSKCIEENIRNYKINERRIDSNIKTLTGEKNISIKQREWYEDGYAKYLKYKANINNGE